MKEANLKIIYEFIEQHTSIVGQPLVGSVFIYKGKHYEVVRDSGSSLWLICKETGGDYICFYPEIERHEFELVPPEYTHWDLIQALAKFGKIRILRGNELCSTQLGIGELNYEDNRLCNYPDEFLHKVVQSIQQIERDGYLV